MPQEQMTQEQILGTIRAARDSVWVINDSIQKFNAAGSLNEELRGNLQRNVGHLQLVVASEPIANSGEDISDLNQAIIDGNNVLDSNPE